MGFTPQQTILKLVFDEETPLHGLTIRARACTVGEWHHLLEIGSAPPETSKDTVEANDEITQLFLDHVVEWDMEIPEGVPVPLTLEGWYKLDNDHSNLIIAAWQVAMIDVPKILQTRLNSGSNSGEQSLDLAKLSESLPSWKSPSLSSMSAIGFTVCQLVGDCSISPLPSSRR